MLDPLPIGEEEVVPLKCALCSLEYDNEEDLESIEDCGYCRDCRSEMTVGMDRF